MKNQRFGGTYIPRDIRSPEHISLKIVSIDMCSLFAFKFDGGNIKERRKKKEKRRKKRRMTRKKKRRKTRKKKKKEKKEKCHPTLRN